MLSILCLCLPDKTKTIHTIAAVLVLMSWAFPSRSSFLSCLGIVLVLSGACLGLVELSDSLEISGLAEGSIHVLDAIKMTVQLSVSVHILEHNSISYSSIFGVTIQIIGANTVSRNFTREELRASLNIAVETPGTHVFIACPWGKSLELGGSIQRSHAGHSSECVEIVFDVFPPNPPLQQYPMPRWLQRDPSLKFRTEKGRSNGKLIHMVFIGDLRPMMNGVQFTRLRQFEYLPRDEFVFSYWDLTCDSEKQFDPGPAHKYGEQSIGNDSFRLQLEALNVTVLTLCTKSEKMDLKEFHQGMQTIGDVKSFFDLPPSFQNLMKPLFMRLQAVDIMIAANGASAHDNYLFHVARLAGVKSRVLDLGPRLHPYKDVDVDAFLAPSEFVRQFPTVRDARSRLDAEVHVVRPGVDLSVFQQQTFDSRRQKWEKTHVGNSSSDDKVKGQVLDNLAAFLEPPQRFQESPHEVIIVGYVGRLSPEKSPGMFLRVAEAVLADRRGLKQQVVKFLIVGDGPLLPYLYGFAANKLRLTVAPPNVAELLFVQVDRLK